MNRRIAKVHAKWGGRLWLVLVVALIVLRATGQIATSWEIVFAPFWLALLIFVLWPISLLMFVFALAVTLAICVYLLKLLGVEQKKGR